MNRKVLTIQSLHIDHNICQRFTCLALKTRLQQLPGISNVDSIADYRGRAVKRVRCVLSSRIVAGTHLRANMNACLRPFCVVLVSQRYGPILVQGFLPGAYNKIPTLSEKASPWIALIYSATQEDLVFQ
jgi:hypothetical protein